MSSYLALANFPYTIVPPHETGLEEEYRVRLLDRSTGIHVYPEDLSSGEKVIFRLLVWIFVAKNLNKFPKLLILDEPDAHLHPSMASQFLAFVQQFLVNKMGARVILSTHSPSTVALAPEGSVFLLSRGATSVRRAENVAEAVADLTAGLITVTKHTKYVFVEDESDVEFYDLIFLACSGTELLHRGPPLSASPSIVFLRASTGDGIQKEGGGCKQVRKTVALLNDAQLATMFFGIIDRDVGNDPTNRVFVHRRYCIENYLVDPLNVYGLLLEDEKAPAIDGLKLGFGDEAKLQSLDNATLQRIIDKITVSLGLNSEEKVEVHYMNGTCVLLDRPWVDRPGKRLLAIVQDRYGTPSNINPVRLSKTLRRTKMIPSELREIMCTIQQA